MNPTTRIRARKALGQHWLVDRNVLRRIASAADIAEDETVIEIGAGTGLLTRLLAERAHRLIAVEVDHDLATSLKQEYAHRSDVRVLEADALALTPEQLLKDGGGRIPYIVAGNLPYFIGTAIVRRFLWAAAVPRRLLVTLQEEVADSMAAPPGRMTYLGVETQMLADATVLFRIPPKAFRPPPKVRSAALRLDVRPTAEIEVDDRGAFLQLVRSGFAAPRKRVRNSLAIGLGVPPIQAEHLLVTAGIDPTLRPARLEFEHWRHLYLAYRAATLRR